MMMRGHLDMEVSSPLSAGVAGDSIYVRNTNMNASALSPSAMAATMGAGGFALGQQASNSRGSAYFGQPGSMSDLGPSASEVGAVQNQSQSQSRIGSADIAAGWSGGSGSGSSPSQGSVPMQAIVNDDLRLEVDNLRREMEKLKEERIAGGGTAVMDEAPPSYQEDTNPVRRR